MDFSTIFLSVLGSIGIILCSILIFLCLLGHILLTIHAINERRNRKD